MNIQSILPMPTPKPPVNGGIVPPWLRDEFDIVLPVEPQEKSARTPGPEAPAR